MVIVKKVLIEKAIRYLVEIIRSEMIEEPSFWERVNQKKYKLKTQNVMKKLEIFEDTLMNLIEQTNQRDIILNFESNDILLRAIQKADIDISILPSDINIYITENAIDFKLFHEIIED